MEIKKIFNDIANVFTNGEPLAIESLGHEVGEYGEFASDRVLNNRALTDMCYLRTVKNVYVEKNGSTTEIDLIAVTEKGVFVIESKNYSGWIFGDINQIKWTQSLQGGEKNHFYNPIKQNEGHIRKLAEYLTEPMEKIYSVIVFSDRCTLKKVPENTEHVKIIKREDLLWLMKAFFKQKSTVYSREKVDAIYEKLSQLADRSEEEKQAHIEEVKGLQEGTICPLCKKTLVYRNGKYGDFYGCSGYPNCKYTRKV